MAKQGMKLTKFSTSNEVPVVSLKMHALWSAN